MPPRKPTTLAVLYARFSPRSKSETCPSCEVQLADLERYCALKGYKIKRPPSGEAGYHDDAMSGKSVANRPQLQAALKALARGDVLLVRDFSRLSRSVWHTIELAEKLCRRGVRLEAKEDGCFDPRDPDSFLLNVVKAGIAQHQRMITGRRTREKTNRYQNIDGRLMSKIPAYGRAVSPTDPKMTVPQPYEQSVIERIKALRSEGLSYRAIAERLDNDGVTCRGKPWVHTTIESILRRADFRHSA